MNVTPRNPFEDEDAQPGASDDGMPPPSPDEDGPHDVPDDKVIEKTLPGKVGSDRAS